MLVEKRPGEEPLIIGQWFSEGPLSAIYELGVGQRYHLHNTGGQIVIPAIS